MCLGIMLKNDDTYVQEMSCIYCYNVMSFHLIFMT